MTSPARDHFFISRRACDNVGLQNFDFMVFLFQNLLLQASPYPRVGGQGFSGQRSRVRAQCSEKILLVFGMLRTPISQNHMLSGDQPSRGSDFLPSEEPAVMSHLTFQLSQLDIP